MAIGKYKGKDINAGTDAEVSKQIAAIDNNSLGSKELSGARDMKLPPTPAPVAAAGLDGALETQSDQFTTELAEKVKAREAARTNSFESLIGALEGSEGKERLTADFYSEPGGVDESEAELKDINDQIRRERVARQRAVERIQTAPGTATAEERDRETREVERVSLRKEADLSIIQLARQGRYDSAKAIADRAVSMQLEEQKQEIEILEKVYNEHKDLFTTAEQRLFETQQADRNRKLELEDFRLRTQYDQTIKQNDPKYGLEVKKLGMELGLGDSFSGDPVSALSEAILGNESNGDYGSLSPVLPSGSAKGQRSYGKYQVLQSNIPSFTEKFYGQRLTPQEFLANPEAQEAVQRGYMQELWARYGNVKDVASVYFTGVPYAQAVAEGRRDQATGMTVQDYATKAEARFNELTAGSAGNPVVDSYVSAIRSNTLKLENVPDYLRNQVVQALAQAPATDELSQAQKQDDIQQISDLVNDPYLSGAVGPNVLSRLSPSSVFTGGKQNFIAGVEQLRSQLNLDTLIQAKGQGATFGALSDQELKVLANAATKIGSWAKKDKNGDVKGYDASQAAFKAELDRINNFAKLDFILKGGDAASVGVIQQADGSYWVENSDGSFTRLR